MGTDELAENASESAQLDRKGARCYVFLAGWVIFWAVVHLFIVLAVFSNTVMLLSYYAVSYRNGFVRRGLAGELLRVFPESDYFGAAYAILWVSTIVWLIALGVLMWLVLSPNIRSERRVLLALLIPVLPFSYSYAIYNSHPEILGMSALLAFSIAIWKARTSRVRVIASSLYGIAIAVLSFIHEAIPLEFTLGTVLAIIVLPKGATDSERRRCFSLAALPGLAAVGTIVLLGRRDISAQLCTQVPHGMVDDPRGTVPNTSHKAFGCIFGQFQGQSDLHDWVCSKIIFFFDLDTFSMARVVASFGIPRLFASFVLGVVFFVATLSVLRLVCGAPARPFFRAVGEHKAIAALAAVLVIPLFVTALDWTRWWTMMALDVGIAYILYSLDKPEIEQRPPKRTVLVSIAIIMVLAVIPFGDVNNVGG
ncbi:hypothetical protein [Mycobacterium vicinigordonae]|uniref:Uncharacterized protein n=1 Tax=Mycobacterium vicinigordonae TaxID=1719132 RepID=A0A7D6E5I3_9MYCO|nr:hypothetical protein [Mycobacterium vicinigordonae]QLL09606.1 hypothetical protein H0P51_12475 [Mycobacterium vicinigordonae]